MTMKISIPHRI